MAEGVLFFVLLAGPVIMFFRNEAVYHYRQRFIEWAYSHPDWPERRKALDEVSYSRMFWQLWRPLDSFGMYKESHRV
jgi:hypothetical protein